MRRRLLAALLGLCAGAAGLRAQSTWYLEAYEGQPEADRVAATVWWAPGAEGPTACGWVEVLLRHDGPQPREVELDLGLRVANHPRIERRVVVAGETRVFLPLLGRTRWTELRFQVDGHRVERGIQVPAHVDTGRLAVLVVGAGGAASESWRALLKGALARVDAWTRRFPAGEFEVLQREPSRVPADPHLLSGFHVVTVDGTAQPVPQELQRALHDYARAGGVLVVSRQGLAHDGVLAAACESAVATGGRCGLGHLFVCAPNDRAADLVAAAQQVVLRDAGFVPPSLLNTVPIPGLGEVPFRLFVVVITGFALVVGPVNYFYWWRRRRLAMLLVTIPALGFGVTVLILAWALLSEGFGVRQVERSVTWIDQARHDAVCVGSTTLYAAMAPAALEPEHRSLPFVGTAERSRSDLLLAEFRWREDGRIAGSAVAARTVTLVAGASFATVRERLRFRGGARGAPTWAAGPGLEPDLTAGPLYYRDFHGRYWQGTDPSGRLESVTPAEVAASLTRFGAARAQPWLVLGLVPEDVVATPDGPMRPGSYLMWARSSPAFDRYGLEPEILGARHLVYGLLAPEDVGG